VASSDHSTIEARRASLASLRVSASMTSRVATRTPRPTATMSDRIAVPNSHGDSMPRKTATRLTTRRAPSAAAPPAITTGWRNTLRLTKVNLSALSDVIVPPDALPGPRTALPAGRPLRRGIRRGPAPALARAPQHRRNRHAAFPLHSGELQAIYAEGPRRKDILRQENPRPRRLFGPGDPACLGIAARTRSRGARTRARAGRG